MIRTIEAVIDSEGNVRLLEEVEQLLSLAARQGAELGPGQPPSSWRSQVRRRESWQRLHFYESLCAGAGLHHIRVFQRLEEAETWLATQ